jgi:crossover junction endodeoxyribonuclease RuvC
MPEARGGTVRVLGVDTSLRSSGIAVVDGQGSRLKAVDYGRIHLKNNIPRSECLAAIRAGLVDVISTFKPDEVSIEGVFYCRNVKTAVILGEARGVVIATCAEQGLSVYEYAPRRVKQAVVGYGNAAKDQVGTMVTKLLKLDKVPQEDAGDALALAICHLNCRSRVTALAPEKI